MKFSASGNSSGKSYNFYQLRFALRSIFPSLVLFLAVSTTMMGRNAELSYWADNLSEGMEAEVRGFPDEMCEVAVAGDSVHTFWFSRNNDYKLSVCYRRSVDGGTSWDPIYEFYQNDANLRDINITPYERHLAVYGNNVHIVFAAYGTGTKSWFGQLVYLRSTNGGASFEAPRVLWSTAADGGSPWHAQDIRVSADADRTVISYRRQRNWNDAWPYEFTAVALTSLDGGQTFSESVAATADNSWNLFDCFVNGEQIAMQYYQSGYSYGYIQYGNMFMAVSGDGGASFENRKISVPSSNGTDKALNAHDQHYSPVIAGANGRIYTAFLSYNESDQNAVYFCRTLDNGASFEPAINLTEGTGIVPSQLTSQFTLTAVNDEVYVLIHTSAAILYLRKSTDGGASFGPLTQITETSSELGSGAWWPVIKAIPGATPDQTKLRIVIAGFNLFSSNDAGATFTIQAFGPRFSIRNADRPQMAIDAAGGVHIVADSVWTWYSTGVFGDRDTLYHCLQPVPDLPEIPGTAIQFTTHINQGDGSGEERFDCLQVPSSPDVLPQDAFTVEFWMKPHQSANPYGDHYPIIKEGPGKGGAWESFLFGVWRSDQADARLTTTVDGYVLVGGPILTPGEWHHLAATFDSNAAEKNFRMYVDGEEISSANTQGTLMPSMAPLSIGSFQGRSQQGAVSLDDVRIWDHARTGEQILQMKDLPLPGPQAGLVAYYPLDGSPRDHSANAHHGIFLYRETAVPGAVSTVNLPRITGGNILSGMAGQPVNYRIITNFDAHSFEAENLPAGLVFDPDTGIITGAPSSGGLFSATLRAIGDNNTAEAVLTLSIEGASETIFTNNNIWAVQSNPPNPTEFTLTQPVFLTFIQNYHYFNNGTPAGTITLRHEDGTEFGPWQTTGSPGQGNVPNAYWEYEPMITLQPGKYTVLDSHPSTWSQNTQSGRAGITTLRGIKSGNAPQAVYDVWAVNTGLSGTAADPNADPDGDDSPNWVEFGLGNNPQIPDPLPAILPVLDNGTPAIMMTQRKGGAGTASDYLVNGIGHHLEAATQLNPPNWAPASAWLQNSQAEATDLGDGKEEISVPLRDTPLPQETWFFRRVMTRNLE